MIPKADIKRFGSLSKTKAKKNHPIFQFVAKGMENSTFIPPLIPHYKIWVGKALENNLNIFHLKNCFFPINEANKNSHLI